MSEDLDDLRRETRKFSDETVTVKFVNESRGGQQESHICRSEDISAGGLKLMSHCSLPLGCKMSIEIDLGEMWAVIGAKAEIKWCLEIDEAPTYYIGIKLIDIEKSNLQVWKKFVEKL